MKLGSSTSGSNGSRSGNRGHTVTTFVGGGALGTVPQAVKKASNTPVKSTFRSMIDPPLFVGRSLQPGGFLVARQDQQAGLLGDVRPVGLPLRADLLPADLALVVCPLVIGPCQTCQDGGHGDRAQRQDHRSAIIRLWAR